MNSESGSYVRLNVAERFAGKAWDTPYFANDERWPWPWKLVLGEVGDEPMEIILWSRRECLDHVITYDEE
jgi:hypothetical protein